MTELEKVALSRVVGRVLSRTRPRMSPTALVAHELGHMKAFLKSGPKVRRLRQLMYQHGQTAADVLVGADVGLRPAASPHFSKRRALISLLAQAPKLAEEAAATHYGLKAMKKLKYISPAQYRKARAGLLKAFGTYGTDAAVHALSVGAPSLLTGRISGRISKPIDKAVRGGPERPGLSPKMSKGLGSLTERAVNIAAFSAAQSAIQGLRKRPIRSLGRGAWKDFYAGHMSGPKARRLLAREMGLDSPVQLDVKRIGMKDNAAYVHGRNLSPEVWKKYFGERLGGKISREGLIAVPKHYRHELTGKKSTYDKLIDLLVKER